MSTYECKRSYKPKHEFTSVTIFDKTAFFITDLENLKLLALNVVSMFTYVCKRSYKIMLEFTSVIIFDKLAIQSQFLTNWPNNLILFILNVVIIMVACECKKSYKSAHKFTSIIIFDEMAIQSLFLLTDLITWYYLF